MLGSCFLNVVGCILFDLVCFCVLKSVFLFWGWNVFVWSCGVGCCDEDGLGFFFCFVLMYLVVLVIVLCCCNYVVEVN